MSQSIVIWVRVGGPHIVSGLASPVHIDGVCRWVFWFHNLAPGDYVIDVKVGGLRQPPMQTPPHPPTHLSAPHTQPRQRTHRPASACSPRKEASKGRALGPHSRAHFRRGGEMTDVRFAAQPLCVPLPLDRCWR